MLNAITPVINHPELSKFTITIELQPQTTVRVNDFCIERLFNESLFNLFNDAFIEILCLTALTFSRLNNQENVSELQQHNPVGPLKRFCKIGIIVAEELGLTSDVFGINLISSNKIVSRRWLKKSYNRSDFKAI